MKLDLEKLKKEKEKNFKERLKFIDLHVEHLKKTKNEVWSKEQKEFLETNEVL